MELKLHLDMFNVILIFKHQLTNIYIYVFGVNSFYISMDFRKPTKLQSSANKTIF